MQLLKTDNEVLCFQPFGCPLGLWLLLPDRHALVLFSLTLLTVNIHFSSYPWIWSDSWR